VRVVFVRQKIYESNFCEGLYKKPHQVFLDFSTPRFAGNDCQSYFEEINYVYFRYTYASTPILNCGNFATNLKLGAMEYCEILEAIKSEVSKASSVEECFVIAHYYYSVMHQLELAEYQNYVEEEDEDYLPF
jgi:hypothetical protein